MRKHKLTEDKVRDKAKEILGFGDCADAVCGVGQLTTFNQLGFIGINDKPDGWYLPNNIFEPAIILETKNSGENLNQAKWQREIIKNCKYISEKYKSRIGILYNGVDIRVFQNENEITETTSHSLESKEFYINIFKAAPIDKKHIYNTTKQINELLHAKFGIKNLYHRMIFTACALVAERYGARLEDLTNGDYSEMQYRIKNSVHKSYEDSLPQNRKLTLLDDVYTDIKMNNPNNPDAVKDFIRNVCDISDCLNSSAWRGEDVMGIFFNEFNRYKGKSEAGQVFTPEHITSFMYGIIHCGKNDYILDAACGSGGFLVKAMSMMIQDAGGPETNEAKEIKQHHLFGIEWDREIYALACANMLIHKDGKTNLTQMDSRTEEACKWIASKKKISKVLMNPPFERKYGCLEIVLNVLDNIPVHTECAFILPDKKLEKDKGRGKRIIQHHTLKKIIKLPTETFNEGVSTSIFIFEAGVPQNGKEIFTCWMKEDGLETVKNQGRQDIRGRWPEIEKHWLEIIEKQSGDDTIAWIKPAEHLSYQEPEKPFSINEEDFMKTMMDYELFQRKMDQKVFTENLIGGVIYNSSISENKNNIVINLKKDNGNDNGNKN